MRAIHFMKIDYVLTRRQMYFMPVFFVLAWVVGKGVTEGAMSLLVMCSYTFFVASIFSTAPFGYCTGKNRGFLLLLPATVKERVAGRFLYGLSFVALLGVLCAALWGVYAMMGYELPLWTVALALCELAVGILMMALEFLFFYLFGEGKENWQYLSNIVRVVPGMVMFFAINAFVGEIQDMTPAGTGVDLEAFAGKFMQAGVAAIVASLLLTAAAAAVCVKVIEKRDYA